MVKKDRDNIDSTYDKIKKNQLTIIDRQGKITTKEYENADLAIDDAFVVTKNHPNYYKIIEEMKTYEKNM